jgi:hypothetical protein
VLWQREWFREEYREALKVVTLEDESAHEVVFGHVTASEIWEWVLELHH